MSFDPHSRKGQPGSLCSELLRAGTSRVAPIGHPSASQPLSEMMRNCEEAGHEKVFNCYINLDTFQRDHECSIT